MPDSALDSDAVIEQVQASDRFDRFVEEIAEHFHDGNYKDDRIPEIKTSFRQEAQKAGLPEGDARAVAGRLIGVLMQEAGQKAPPRPDDGVRINPIIQKDSPTRQIPSSHDNAFSAVILPAYEVPE